MTAIKLREFNGMNPRSGLKYMQNEAPMMAELAVNCDLLSGDLKPHRRAEYIQAIPISPQQRAAFRMPPVPGFPDEYWVSFEQRYTHFLEAPLVEDSFNRWYWTEEGQVPKFNTRQRIENDDSPYRLGCPQPVNTLTVTPPGTSADIQRQRCYLVCFVSEFGEVGAPGPITCATGDETIGWTIDNIDAAPPSISNPQYPATTHVRIYRTVTGTTGGSFFFVVDIPIGQTSYTDNTDTATVAYNEQLNTFSATPPPEDLIGIIAHPNGFMVGYRGNELWMSEPFKPWAWPAAYVLAMESNIQGLGVYGTSIVVTTQAHPYHCTGISPDTMTLSKYHSTEPNLSRDSVVSVPQGVFYAGFNGLVLASNQQFTLATQDILTMKEWQNRYRPESLRGARHGFQYIGWTSDVIVDTLEQAPGFLFAVNERDSYWTEFKIPDVIPDYEGGEDPLENNILVFQTDIYNGRVYVSVVDELYWLFGETTPPSEFLWRGKEFVTPKPVNMGFYDIDFTEYNLLTSESLSNQRSWNEGRIQFPLNTFGGTHEAGGSSEKRVIPLSFPTNRMPAAGSPLFDLGSAMFGGAPFVRLRIYADRVLRHERFITRPGQYRAPSGFKAHRWQFEIEGNCELKYLDIAETGKELANV